MIRLLGLAISIGIADSLNPTTIAPALYLAAGKHPRRQVAEFTLAVFGVYLVGGLAIALGPGKLVLALVPHPSRHLSYVLEMIVGGAMLVAAGFLWGYRKRLASRTTPEFRANRRRSSALLGATITAVELPTAFPYFAVIAAIVGSDLDIVREVLLFVIFNACFVAPLLGILATLTFKGDDAQRALTAGRAKLEAHWPAVLAILALVAGLFVAMLGVTGLALTHHNDFGTLSRKLRSVLHLHS